MTTRITTLLLALFGGAFCNAFVAQQRQRAFFVKSPSSLSKTGVRLRMMVRNIDLPEAIVFYGWDALLDETKVDAGGDGASSSELKAGVKGLLDECDEVGSAVILIVPQAGEVEVEEEFDADLLERRSRVIPPQIQVVIASQPAPNPRALCESLEMVVIQPRGFGGSSGFGRKAADPQRNPEPKHVVVLTTTEEQCLAARYVGTRVVCLDNDNDFADAVVDGWDEFGLDDIATPGSYWLNPPQPNDGYGNRIDLMQVIQEYEQQQQQRKPFMSINDDGGMQENEIASILSNIDPIDSDSEATTERKPFMSVSSSDMREGEMESILADMDPPKGADAADENDMAEDDIASILADLDPL